MQTKESQNRPLTSSIFSCLPALALLVLSSCQIAPSHSSEIQRRTERVAGLTGDDFLDTTYKSQFDSVMAFAKEQKLDMLPIGEVVKRVGVWFKSKPYVAGSLDKSIREQLVIKLDGFDCVTFVESVLALSRTIKDQSFSYERFANALKEQRYRNNILDGYCSRLHYFSEWIQNNEEKSIIRDVTRTIGGILLEKRLNFMSTHRESYPLLASSDSLYEQIIEVERELEDLELYHIPQNEIRDVYREIQSGDILAMTTDIPGLDVVHTGIAYRFEDGRVGLLHASTVKGITLSPDLQQYVENNPRQIGIVVARPID